MKTLESKPAVGHLTALLTVFIWGTTFISTKVLLADFSTCRNSVFPFYYGIFCAADHLSPKAQGR